MKPCNRFLLPALLTFALPGVLLAQSKDDRDLGTWVLNISKSSFRPRPAPRSETRTYENTADGMIHLTVHIVAADGSTSIVETTYRRDGKPYPLSGNPNYDALESRHVNNEVRAVYLRRGKMVGHNTGVWSKDGNTLTFTTTYRTTSGMTEHQITVWDRQ